MPLVVTTVEEGMAELEAITAIINKRVQAVQLSIRDAGFDPLTPRLPQGPWDAEKAKAEHERARLWHEASIVKNAAVCATAAVAALLRLTASIAPTPATPPKT